MKRAAILAAILIVTAGACSSSPEDNEATSKRIYCERLATFNERIDAIAKGTVTTEEAVDSLAKSQQGISEASDAALAAETPDISQALQSLSDNIGRLKVAIAEGGDVAPAQDAIITDLNNIPDC